MSVYLVVRLEKLGVFALILCLSVSMSLVNLKILQLLNDDNDLILLIVILYYLLRFAIALLIACFLNKFYAN